MIYLDETLLDLLNKHSIEVKIERNPQIKNEYFRLSIHSKSAKPLSILIWKFDVWFIIEGLANIYKDGGWSKKSYDTIMDAIITNEMQQHPTHLVYLLPYMSDHLKIKYASNITGHRFDM
jgi:hypothetical protein